MHPAPVPSPPSAAVGASTRLARDPVYRLLWRLSLPAAVAMGVNALYNLADTLFVGRGVGGLAVGAIAISFPLVIMQVALGLILGVGGGSIISRALGAGKMRRAGEVLGTVIVMQLIFSIIFTVAAHATLPMLIRFLGATDEIMPLTLRYARIIVSGSLFNMYNLMFANLIRAEGRVMWSTTMFVTGALVNIALDLLFIFVFALGMRGAAVATVLSQMLSFAIAIIFYCGRHSEIRIRIPRGKRLRQLTVTVCALGVGAALRQWGEVAVLITANNLLRKFGTSWEISAYGIVHRILLFSLLPIVGVAHALLPIVGYNWGAKQYGRAVAALQLGNRISFFVGLPIAILEICFAAAICSLFVLDAQIRTIATTALRITAFTVPLIPIQLNCANYFQAIGDSGKTIIIHSARQFLFIVLLLLILSHLFGLLGIWSAFIAGDALTILLSLLLFRHSKLTDHRRGRSLR